MQGVDLALIMHKLNHESVAYTKRYLGITDEELQAVVQRLGCTGVSPILSDKAKVQRLMCNLPPAFHA